MTRTTAIQRLAVLSKLEWDWRDGGPRCPVCKAHVQDGHTDACKMAAFIADVEDDVKWARNRRELRARHKRDREKAREQAGR